MLLRNSITVWDTFQQKLRDITWLMTSKKHFALHYSTLNFCNDIIHLLEVSYDCGLGDF